VGCSFLFALSANFIKASFVCLCYAPIYEGFYIWG
jgi:hypothetical protein